MNPEFCVTIGNFICTVRSAHQFAQPILELELSVTNLYRHQEKKIHVLKIASSALQRFILSCTACASVEVSQLEYLVLLFYQELIFICVPGGCVLML